MKNFDEGDPDMAFTISGEEFHVRYVRPEVLAVWEDAPTIDKAVEVLKANDELICQFLSSDEERERWKALRAQEDNAIPAFKINEVLRWIIEVQAGRPTNPQSNSGAGRTRTEASSKAA